MIFKRDKNNLDSHSEFCNKPFGIIDYTIGETMKINTKLMLVALLLVATFDLPLADVNATPLHYVEADNTTKTAKSLITKKADVNNSKSYGKKVGEKVLNGFVNLTTAVLEIPKNIINTANESDATYGAIGAIGGVFKGLLHTVARFSTGLADVITAPLPTKPVAYPIHVWDDFDVDTTYNASFRLDK